MWAHATEAELYPPPEQENVSMVSVTTQSDPPKNVSMVSVATQSNPDKNVSVVSVSTQSNPVRKFGGEHFLSTKKDLPSKPNQEYAIMDLTYGLPLNRFRTKAA